MDFNSSKIKGFPMYKLQKCEECCIRGVGMAHKMVSMNKIEPTGYRCSDSDKLKD